MFQVGGNAGTQTLALASTGGLPEVIYWGPSLPATEDLRALADAAQNDLTGGMIDRLAALSLTPERAVDIARRLHTPFLADVCLELDPRHVRELIAAMPVKRIVEVAHELAARREYITMARFVDVLQIAKPHRRPVGPQALRPPQAPLRAADPRFLPA